MRRTCKAITGRRRGFWDFLIKREDRRRDVELEKVRDAGTQSAIEALPPGGQLIEIDGTGRSRMIWMPEAPPAVRRVVAQREDRPNGKELPQ